MVYDTYNKFSWGFYKPTALGGGPTSDFFVTSSCSCWWLAPTLRGLEKSSLGSWSFIHWFLAQGQLEVGLRPLTYSDESWSLRPRDPTPMKVGHSVLSTLVR